jgi:hypothetical protein
MVDDRCNFAGSIQEKGGMVCWRRKRGRIQGGEEVKKKKREDDGGCYIPIDRDMLLNVHWSTKST